MENGIQQVIVFGEVKMDRISPQITIRGKFDFQYENLKAGHGIIYYYKVSAFDQAGNESRISLEEIQDTACPAGTDIN